MRRSLFIMFFALLALPVQAENQTPYPGTKVIETGQPFDAFFKKLTAAIGANKMEIVGNACATCGAKAIGVTIPGNRVLMIFNPHFAVRMLRASEAAGIEAPIRPDPFRRHRHQPGRVPDPTLHHQPLGDWGNLVHGEKRDCHARPFRNGYGLAFDAGEHLDYRNAATIPSRH